MAWNPIAQTVPQYVDENGDPASGYILKAYAAGTSTVISLATDNTGSTVASSISLNSRGFPEVSGNIVIPHVEQDYKLALYPSQAAADSNSGAIWTIDNIETTGAASNEWQASGVTPTRTTDTTFTLSGDQTSAFHINRRLRLTDSGGIDYASITAVSYSDPTTTVTVAIDNGGALDAGLSAVDLSILSGNNSAAPSLYKVVATNSSIGTDVVTLSVNPSVVLEQGLEVTFKAGGTNTTATTLNINSTGAKNVKNLDGSDLRAADLTTGRMYTVVYDGTDYILVTGGKVLNTQFEKNVAQRILLGDSGAISSEATVNFDDVFTSTYDAYEIEVLGIVPATDNTILYIRLGTGATYENGASAYAWSASGSLLDAAAAWGEGEDNADSEIQTSSVGIGNAAGEHFNAYLRVLMPTNSSLFTIIQGEVNFFNDSTIHAYNQISGHRTSAISTPSIQFLMSSGNISSGRIRVYGLTNGSL